MIIVHEIFICKPGNASKLAKKFKEGLTGMPEFLQVMTDLVGQFNKVVIVCQYQNLTAYEQSFEKYMQESRRNEKDPGNNGGLPGYVYFWLPRNLPADLAVTALYRTGLCIIFEAFSDKIKHGNRTNKN